VRSDALLVWNGSVAQPAAAEQDAEGAEGGREGAPVSAGDAQAAPDVGSPAVAGLPLAGL